MKKWIFIIAAALIATGCASRKYTDPQESGDMTPVNAQKLTSNFTRQGIKVEWECKWLSGITNATCIKGDIKAIEVVGYAPAFGNSEVNRENAFKVANDVAMDKLIRFIKQDVSSNRVVETLTKNVEKANDHIRARINMPDIPISVSDTDPTNANINTANRQNINETVRTVTESIVSNSRGILRGVQAIEEKIVDRQTVAVTIRWDNDSEIAAKQLQKRISR